MPRVLDNLRGWAGDVFVLDSGSTDRTVDFAIEGGARVAQRRFTNFGDQWNFALKRLPIRTPWTLKVDPDERLTPALKEEIAELTARPQTPHHGYEMKRRLWFMGRPLSVKAPVLRLWRTGRCRFSDVLVNEHPLIDGTVGRLSGLIEHHDSLDLHHWFEKQNRYSTMEAIMMVRGDKLAAEPRPFGNPLQRRMWLKRVFFRLPFRYQIQFVHDYLGRGAWRDGRLGLTWARLRVTVWRMRELKASEMRRTGRIPDLPRAAAGPFDPRVVASDLQRTVISSAEGETCGVEVTIP